MAKYIVRQSCEYSMLVEADNEEEAVKKATQPLIDLDEWEKAWSGIEVDEE